MTNREWWEAFNDIWQFVKKHNAPKTDTEWEKAVSDAAILSDRHAGAKDIVMDILEAWEREGRSNG